MLWRQHVDCWKVTTTSSGSTGDTHSRHADLRQLEENLSRNLRRFRSAFRSRLRRSRSRPLRECIGCVKPEKHGGTDEQGQGTGIHKGIGDSLSASPVTCSPTTRKTLIFVAFPFNASS